MPIPSMTARLVCFATSDRSILVVPPDKGSPFPVPQFPMSQLVWLDELAAKFRASRGRCLSVALMLDLTRQAWGRPHLPTQHCGVEGVRWAWRAEDFAGRGPCMLVAGSYQSAVLRDTSEAAALVPPVDGVHLIGAVGPVKAVYAFVHTEGRTSAIEAKAFVIDDVAATLDANACRLTLE